jgi:hypothetical protein
MVYSAQISAKLLHVRAVAAVPFQFRCVEVVDVELPAVRQLMEALVDSETERRRPAGLAGPAVQPAAARRVLANPGRPPLRCEASGALWDFLR